MILEETETDIGVGKETRTVVIGAYEKLTNCVGIAWNHKHLKETKEK